MNHQPPFSPLEKKTSTLHPLIKVSSCIMQYVMVDYFYGNDKPLRTMHRTSWTFNLLPYLKVLPQKLQIKLNLNADYWIGAEYHEPSKKCSSQLLNNRKTHQPPHAELNNRKTHQPPHADKLSKAFKPRTDLRMNCLRHCKTSNCTLA